MKKNFYGVEAHLERIYFMVGFNKLKDTYSRFYGNAKLTIGMEQLTTENNVTWSIDIWYNENHVNSIFIVDHYVGNPNFYPTEDFTTLYRKNKKDIFYIVADMHYPMVYEAYPLLTKKDVLYTLKFNDCEYCPLPSLKRYAVKCKVCGKVVVGNGIVGRVKETSGPVLRFDEDTGQPHVLTTFYNNNYYQRLPRNEWYVKTWYNSKEYEEMRKFFPDWKDFEQEWDSNRKLKLPLNGWRDVQGGILEFSETPTIGAYEKVIYKGIKDTYNPDTVECPCCKRLNEAYKRADVRKSSVYRVLSLLNRFRCK